MADDVPRHLCAAPVFGDERVELRLADSDERKFRRDKKSVQQHEREHGQDFQRD
jgi:hypothetical protein